MSDDLSGEMTIHGTCVALSETAGLLIKGRSGAGKSSLALTLMAYGAHLVSDDQVILKRAPEADVISARAPLAIKGMIEARGVGLLNAQGLESCALKAIVDLDRIEEERLPPRRKERLIGLEIPLYHRVDAPHFAPSLMQLLKGGRGA